MAVARFSGERAFRSGTRRGSQLKLYVVVDAADAYSVVSALPEFDLNFTDRTAFLADQQDGQAIAPP